MAKRPAKFDLEAVRDVQTGTEARARKRHNLGKAAPGDILEAKTPAPERDRLERAVKRSFDAAKADKAEREEGKPRPGETLYAESQQAQEDQNREKVRKFLQLAQERFHLSQEAESKMRSDALDDLKFRTGEQWPQDIQKQRQIDGRPCLTMNRIPQFIRQVTNEQRQQRPSVHVDPIGDGADLDTAEILQGTIRHIENISDAEVAYDLSFEQMVTGGFGWFRVLTQVLDNEANQQEIYIKPIRNQFTVYDDPAAREPDRSDARFRFIIEDMPISEYRNLYGDTEAATLTDFSSIGDNAAEWKTKDTIRVAEYFYIEETNTATPKVFWAKINAIEVLEGNEDRTAGREWPGKFIPVIPVLGDDLDVDGQRYVAGMVRHIKDPQRMYNFWVSAATEMIALAPKAPFVGAEGQFEGHEKEWEQANVRNFAKLEYKPKTLDEQLLPKPERQTAEPPIQAINMMTRQADLDIKGVAGIYDPSLGQNKQDQSGRAINLLQKQGDIANLNWVDNLSRSIRHLGRVLIDLIPKIYDAPRIQRIVKPDGESQHVVVHNQQPDEAQGLLTDQIQKVYDLGVGQYDVTVSVGPSYHSKRQEAVAGQMALVQAAPQVAPIIMDLLVGNMDWPQSKEMAKRLKRAMPPQLQDEDDGSDPEQTIMRLQSQLQALSQQHQVMTQALQQQNEIIKGKQVEQQSRENVAHIQATAQITVAEINKAVTVAQAQIQAAQEQWGLLHDSAHERGMQAQDHAHELELAAAQPEPAGGTQ